MREKTKIRGMGLLLVLVVAMMAGGCCARLQSPIVFENCGWANCGNPCGQTSCCNPCVSAPCNPVNY